jgi:hypothetical protein
MLSLLLIAAAATSTVNPDNVVRCVREEITGSLARVQRVCHTVREWRDIHDRANDEARRIIRPGDPNAPREGGS